MLKVVKEKGIERLTFHYTSLDGKLRELELAARTNVEGNVFSDKKRMKHLEALPASSVQCARLFDERREMYEEFGVFPKTVIDHQIQLLLNENDEHLNKEFPRLPTEERLMATRELMHKDIHRH